MWGDYTDDGPESDIDADASMLADSATAWEREKQLTDERIHARHNGHADLIRERIDGRTGEQAPPVVRVRHARASSQGTVGLGHLTRTRSTEHEDPDQRSRGGGAVVERDLDGRGDVEVVQESVT